MENTPDADAVTIVLTEGKVLWSRDQQTTITVHRLGMSIGAIFSFGFTLFLRTEQVMSVETEKGNIVILFRDENRLPQRLVLPFGGRREAERAHVQIITTLRK